LCQNAIRNVTVRTRGTDCGADETCADADAELGQMRSDVAGVGHVLTRAGAALKRESVPRPKVHRHVDSVEILILLSVLARERGEVVDLTRKRRADVIEVADGVTASVRQPRILR